MGRYGRLLASAREQTNTNTNTDSSNSTKGRPIVRTLIFFFTSRSLFSPVCVPNWQISMQKIVGFGEFRCKKHHLASNFRHVKAEKR